MGTGQAEYMGRQLDDPEFLDVRREPITRALDFADSKVLHNARCYTTATAKLKANGLPMVAKIVSKKVASNEMSRNMKSYSKSLKASLRKSTSKQLVKLMSFSDFFQFGDTISYAIPYFEEGSLQKVLLKIKSSTEQIVAQFSYLILSELAEVYKSEERHFNLKPSNVLFYKSETGGLRLTLADHNLEALSVQNTDIFSSFYYPVEMMKDQKFDVWSLGVIIYLMIYGRLPFKALNLESVRQQALLFNWEVDDPRISEQLNNLFGRIFKRSAQRISIEQLMKHTWFRNKNSKQLPMSFAAKYKQFYLSLELLRTVRCFVKNSNDAKKIARELKNNVSNFVLQEEEERLTAKMLKRLKVESQAENPIFGRILSQTNRLFQNSKDVHYSVYLKKLMEVIEEELDTNLELLAYFIPKTGEGRFDRDELEVICEVASSRLTQEDIEHIASNFTQDSLFSVFTSLTD